MGRDEIRCPKCGGEMPSRARSGIVIEQCVDCYGIYLDPGEFERLVTAESTLLGPPEPQPDGKQPEPLHGGSRPRRFLA